MLPWQQVVSPAEGYVHQVDHHPAGVHAEAVRLDVTSCGEDAESEEEEAGSEEEEEQLALTFAHDLVEDVLELR